MGRAEIDLRPAINAISDVVQNRPSPLREFDQIYMKAGDMVMQSEFVAHWADGKRLGFIGDGDAISVCSMYLKQREILDYGPAQVTVFDFDEHLIALDVGQEDVASLRSRHLSSIAPPWTRVRRRSTLLKARARSSPPAGYPRSAGRRPEQASSGRRG